MTEKIEIEYYPCARCGTAVKTRWTERGMLSDYNENVLVADWVYHPSCWEAQLIQYPP